MAGPHVLQIGMNPDVIDFTPWPGQSAEDLRGRIEQARTALHEAGFSVSTCLLPDDADAAASLVADALTATDVDVVEIGAGLRTSQAYTPIFEQVINTITGLRPGARLCFNDSPETTLEAVRRAIPARVNIERIVPNLVVSDLPRAVHDHVAVLGLEVVMDHGWIVTLAQSGGRQLSLLTQDATAPVNPDVSVFVDDVAAAYERATAAGVEIIHPLTAEEWGVTRFFYRDASGNVINVGSHSA